MTLRRLLSFAALAVLFAAPAHADAETDALRAEIKSLEVRLDQLEKKQATAKAPAAVAVAPNTALPLEKRVAIVERKQEVADDVAKAQAEKTPAVEVGPKGLSVTSPDKQYGVNLHAYLQADDREFFGSGPSRGTTDTFLLRSARPIIDAKMTDYFNGRIMMDFGKGQTTLLDAYGDLHPMPGDPLLNFRLGEFKVPIGIERLQSEQELLFVERGQTTNLVPYRDIGASVYGQLIPDQLEYQLAILNGASDLQANTGDLDKDKDLAARLYTNPFRWSDITFLRGLGFGVGGTYGVHVGTVSNPNLTTGYVTTGQRVFFNYRNAAGQVVFANGPQWRINPEAMYYKGPLGLMAEYVANDQEVTRGGTSAHIRNDAWEGIASYVLTGEDASFDGVKVNRNFNPRAGDWGAFEIAARESRLDVDNKAFPFYADPTTSARSAFESTLGANWYLNNSVKLNMDFSYTTFNGGAPNGDHTDEKALLTRAQFRF